MSKGRILVADDETSERNALSVLLRDEGYEVELAPDGFKALGKVDEWSPDLVLSDLKMPGLDGVEILRKLKSRGDDIPVVIMTSFGAVETAVAAMRDGAVDYLVKPLNADELLVVLDREMERVRMRRETRQMRARLTDRYSFKNIIGSSAPMEAVFEAVAQVAPSRASVLITGESGTGKELIAAALHEHSPRAKGPFVKLHCAALAESLLESELFGHERGSFTGATGRRDGRFSQANGGTLFLDEIGEISAPVQVKLLRFLQEHEFERVGGNETVKVDVRVIAATNRDLKAEVEKGRFREDLYYRLNVINIEMPPLRERRTDIPLLAMHFLKKYAGENGKAIEGFTDDALVALEAYRWPGNVRELENAIERAVVLCNGARVGVAELPRAIRAEPARPDAPVGIRMPGSTMAELERWAITTTLEATGGSTAKAAEMLGISIRTIQYRMHEFQEAPKGGAPALRERAKESSKESSKETAKHQPKDAPQE
jgi:DNA-binding NtrC family response regulator